MLSPWPPCLLKHADVSLSLSLSPVLDGGNTSTHFCRSPLGVITPCV